MDIILLTGDHDYRTVHSLYIDGEEFEYIGLTEPEDAIIGRDLIDGNDIIKYIQMGYNAAKNGQELKISYGEIPE